MDKEKVQKVFESLQGELKKLKIIQKEKALAPYEKRCLLEKISKTEIDVAKLHRMLYPRPKFRFSARKNRVIVAKQEVDIGIANEIVKQAAKDQRTFIFSDNSNMYHKISLSSSQDVQFARLSLCRVICPTCSTAYLDDLNHCIIICSNVSGAVHIERCKNCIFVLSCHQLRIHKTHNCLMLNHTGSDPIIEESDGLQVAPLNIISSEFPREDIDFTMDELKDPSKIIDLPAIPEYTSPIENKCMNIKDFSWMKEEETPNWKKISHITILDAIKQYW
ncbi:Tubulin-specific chaperone C like protein [Aduncisulcus paluster]|uniref:Tubulin-specific chaperone C like protein n=1 Tax=Aduncisulcus paluster TaxID=2918883 RepID=A0ABQ5K123_9EUKA|nr:Tubulin-specific chaperone C like protein [Aduncisulcus paluster]